MIMEKDKKWYENCGGCTLSRMESAS